MYYYFTAIILWSLSIFVILFYKSIWRRFSSRWWGGIYIDFKHWFVHRYWIFTKGYCYCLSWSANYNIAKFSLPLIKEIRANKDSIPMACYDVDGQTLSQLSKERSDELDKKARQKWDNILDSIIFALEYCIEKDWKKHGIDTGKTQKCEVDQLFYPDGMEPIYNWEKLKEVEERVDLGLQNFGTYFQNLWT